MQRLRHLLQAAWQILVLVSRCPHVISTWEFIPLETERYFLACRQETLKFAQVQELQRIVTSPKYRYALDCRPGYDGPSSARVVTLGEAFPVPARKKRA